MHLNMRFDWVQNQFRGDLAIGSPTILKEDNNNTVMNILCNNDSLNVTKNDLLNETRRLEEEKNPQKTQ